MRKILSLIFTTIFTIVITACTDDEETGKPQPAQNITRTVMIYMSGENNLTNYSGYHFLQNDINEMIEGSKNMAADQRLLVYVDSLNSSRQKDGTPYIMEIHGGKTTILRQYEEDMYSSDPAVMKEVLQWMITNAPADSYGLVFWGHATGWTIDPDSIETGTNISKVSSRKRAYGVDTGSDNKNNIGERWMNITQMGRVLSELPKLAFIFMDCCNMMCAEVGYELKDATSYLIGSPSEIPGDGAPYHMIVPQLYKEGSQLYKGIIDSYYDYYLDYYKSYRSGLNGYSLPLSVIDTKYIEDLALKTHNVMEQLKEPYPSYPDEPDLEGDSVAFYLHYDSPIMYDMRAFVKTYATETAFEQWDAVYKLAVPYYRMSMEWMTIYNQLEYSFQSFKKDALQNGCVSMFIPRNIDEYYLSEFNYNKTANLTGWNKIMDWGRFGWEE